MDSSNVVDHSHADLGPILESELQLASEPEPYSGIQSELNCAVIETQYPFSLAGTDYIPESNQITTDVIPISVEECCDKQSTTHFYSSPVRGLSYTGCGDGSNSSSPLLKKNGQVALMSPRSV